MALCAAAEDTNDSSDLGPPPVSRYVEDNQATHSPPRAVETYVPESPSQPLTGSSPPRLDHDMQLFRSPEPGKEEEEIVVKDASPSKDPAPARQPAREPPAPPVRASAKRKYGDENGTIQSITPLAGKENNVLAEKAFPTRGGQKRRSLAELAGAKPEKKNTRAPLSAKRTPLAAKSTNEDVSSPRKAVKAGPLKDARKDQQRGLGDSVMLDEANAPKPPVDIVIPDDHVLLESATALPSATPSSPSTPPRPAQTEVLHDTPPPADISSTGETTRPSRRARAAVSYAEPNLRDKMRRPTKELFDAVTGEGKYAHRTTAHTKSDGHHSAPTSVSKVKLEPGSSTGGSTKTTSISDRTSMAQQQALLSPLAQKDVFPEALSHTVVMERRKRPSGVGSRESLAVQERSDSPSREPSPATVAQPEAATHTSSNRLKTNNDNKIHEPLPTAEVDIYDFTASSPATSSSKQATPDTSGEFKPPITTNHNNSLPTSRPRTTRKSSMAAAAALRELLDEEEEGGGHDAKSNPRPAPPPPPKSRTAHGGRKRASMLAPKKTSMLLEESLGDSSADADTSGTSAEGESGTGREGRIARRRSMML